MRKPCKVHRFDTHPTSDKHVVCSVCGVTHAARLFPAKSLSYDVKVARTHATPAALARMDAVAK